MRILARSEGRGVLTAIAFVAIATTLVTLAARGETTCPDDCSGRGVCVLLNGSSAPFCRCDPGYIGRDCSVVQCCVDDDCDDGDPFTADLCDVSSGLCQNPPEVAAIRCYPARPRKGSAKFQKLDVRVVDALEAKNATLQKPSLICDFVSVDGRELLNATDGFECFSLKDLKRQEKLKGIELNATTELFGVQRLAVKAQGKQLCLRTPLLAPGTCPAGQGPSLDGAGCRPCGPGTHQPVPGAGECVACPPGTASSEPGATRCRRCAPGFFANGSGAESCAACPAGFFTNETGAPACEPCPEGTVAQIPGRSVCTLCPPGSMPGSDGAECVP
jgi:hypothetical protein